MARQIPRPVLNYFGGKFRLAPWVVEHLPPHETYVEPFCGAASVLLAKPRSRHEVINDLDGDIVNLFRVLRRPRGAQELARRLRLTPHARAEFERAYEPAGDPVERARRTVVRSYFGVSNVGVMRRTGFRITRGTAAAWASWPDVIVAVTARLRGVTIEQRPAERVMAELDGPETLHYLDPPYVLATRANRTRTYRHEMTEADHARLLEAVLALRGSVAISGYPHPLYDEALAGWTRHQRPARNGAGAATTEVLWVRP